MKLTNIRIFLAVLLCGILVLACVGCKEFPTSSVPAPQTTASTTAKQMPNNIVATGTYNGQTISLEYVETDSLYPNDVRAVRFQNGCAVFFDYGKVDAPYENNQYDYQNTWNAINTNGIRLFEQPYLELTSFNKDGLAVAYSHDNKHCFVVSEKGDVTASYSAVNYPYGEEDYPIDVPSHKNQEEKPTIKTIEDVDFVSYPYEGLCAFVKDDHLGIADTDGNIVIPATVPLDFKEMVEKLFMDEDIIVISPQKVTDASQNSAPLVLIKIHRK